MSTGDALLSLVRQRGYAYASGLLVFVVLLVGVALWVFRVRSIGVSIDVHSYERQQDAVSASLVLTNTGTVWVAVPLRFDCQVDSASGLTNYLIETPYSVFLRPRQHVILSNKLWQVRLPANASAWKVNLPIRRMSARERFVDAARQAGFLKPRMSSRFLGRPRKETDYQWLECESSLLKVPETLSRPPRLQKNEDRGA
jgi:hypothetical protein